MIHQGIVLTITYYIYFSKLIQKTIPYFTQSFVDGVNYTYEYLDGMLLYETRGEAKFWYSYDSNGILYNIRYTLTDDSDLMSYYCTHNSRGDIIGIYNGDGVLRAQYEYDAWGNVISVTDENGNAITSATHVGNLNPFRYRGYYYDTESGFYYLMSRYYDPVTHRFINADGYFELGNSILAANTFAYCSNNPINNSDPKGEYSCGDPTCVICNYSRRDFVINNYSWIIKVNPNFVKYNATIQKKETTIYNSSSGLKVVAYENITISTQNKLNYFETSLSDSIVTKQIRRTPIVITQESDYNNMSAQTLVGYENNDTILSYGCGITLDSTYECWDTTCTFKDCVNISSGIKIYKSLEYQNTELAVSVIALGIALAPATGGQSITISTSALAFK